MTKLKRDDIKKARKDKNYIAIDQYGTVFKHLKYPRKDLCALIGVKKADKMYVDSKNGQPLHVGYVIGGHWLNVFEITPLHESNKQ